MKVVVNRSNRFFDLSVLAIKRIAELNGVNCYFFKDWYTGEESIYKYKSLKKISKSEKQPSIIWESIKTLKNKVCPIIELED